MFTFNIVISITEDLHVAILKSEHALTDHYRALQFLAAMLAFLLLILFLYINTTTLNVTVYPTLIKYR